MNTVNRVEMIYHDLNDIYIYGAGLRARPLEEWH